MTVTINHGGRLIDAELVGNKLAFRGTLPLLRSITVNGRTYEVLKTAKSAFVPEVNILILDI